MTYTVGVSDARRLPDRCPRALTAADDADRLLVQRCAQRDAAALREIVRRYQPPVSRFLRQIIGSPEDAEEAALDVFLRVWQQAHRFEGRAAFTTWLYRIAANAACDRLRQKKGRRQTVPLEDAPAAALCSAAGADAERVALERLERAERAERMQAALAQMRVEDRLLLVLYYTEEWGYAEIEQITSLSRPVLKMRLLRARRRLRLLLGEEAQ